ncbi:EF-hand domain-containing protein [Cohaesibacter gelatinilyticus]|uniref:EF hand n=1 Tax=Cohaesibacter gelatinilyticus TaxID=372072 RepID=A0A285PC96_9HYPH|nr:EF-hand domain-containing protein [Cohaesibacter gelatinilyticus]SNZ19352.1 EF hand [Cohaesibacter gelatinilyticus]
MKYLTTRALILFMTIAAVPTQADEATPGGGLAKDIYGSIEDNPNGRVDLGEFINFGRSIFDSMDSDESGHVDFSEFTEWDFGFNFIAEEKGQEQAYKAAQKIIFAFWDRDGDGKLQLKEYHKSMNWDFNRADLNDDAFLSRNEFLEGYIVNVAYRAAIAGL